MILKRLFLNFSEPVPKFKGNSRLFTAPIIAVSESDLWNVADNKSNWILTAGKVENLRIAAKKLNGIEVNANQVFSFWRHIQNPNIGQGYVIGREIKEGCIVPTIAGGLCQLSNALYDTALKANFEIVERHQHTQVVKGSLAEINRDATVKWNYKDLRFKSSFDFRIEVDITSDKLIVLLKSPDTAKGNGGSLSDSRPYNKLNDCLSCGNYGCFRHQGEKFVDQQYPVTTFILDKYWPEYDLYLKSVLSASDHFIMPVNKFLFLKSPHYKWTAPNPAKSKYLFFSSIYRAIRYRNLLMKKVNVFELGLEVDKIVARDAASKIPIESTHLVISQNLLPFLMETGALGARTFDVLMTRLPLEKLHQKLDLAYALYPQSNTLKDFRVTQQIIDLENKALTLARKIITAHTEIAEIFKNKVVKLHWHHKEGENIISVGQKCLFPASAIGRKGAYEIRRLAHELNLTLVTEGRELENENFWKDVKEEKFNGDYSQIKLAIYPAYIENEPRRLLSLISKGIPVIITEACGIESSSNVKVIATGKYEELKAAVHELINAQ